MKGIFSVLVENRDGVLSSISGLFARRGFNIDSLAVGETDNHEISSMTIISTGDQRTIDQIEKQLNKKKQLLELMTPDEYNYILSFLEDVYLSEYDLKIFTGRASNLFLAFKDLLLEENGGRAKVLYRGKYTTPEKEPIIVADKVLDYHTSFLCILFLGRLIS